VIKIRKNLNNKKGQAVIQFLFNYGWVLIIIIVVLAVFALVMLREEMFFSDSCALPAPFGCKEFQFTENQVMVNVVNGGAVALQGISAVLTCNNDYEFTEYFNADVPSGGNFTLLFRMLPEDTTRAKCAIKIRATEKKFKAYPNEYIGTLGWKKINQKGVRPPERCAKGEDDEGWRGDDDFDGCGDGRDSQCFNKDTLDYNKETDFDPTCNDTINNDCGGGGTDCDDINCADAWIYCGCQDERQTTVWGETDIDCGGQCANPQGNNVSYKCGINKKCLVDDDCDYSSQKLRCNAVDFTCVSCFDGDLSPGESDFDCGGLDCRAEGRLCAYGRICYAHADCVDPGSCHNNKCYRKCVTDADCPRGPCCDCGTYKYCRGVGICSAC